MSLNLKEVYDKEYIRGYFKRNKKIYLTSIIIFILLGLSLFMIFGSSQPISFNSENFDEIPKATLEELSAGFTLEEYLSLTLHNIIQDLTCLLGGLIFGIPTLIITMINSYNFTSIFLTFPLKPLLFGILPHGIFEIPSSIVALAGGIMLFLSEINVIKGLFSKNTTVGQKIDESQYYIKDAIISIAIVLVLLIIAGCIETFITPVLLVYFG